MNSYDDLYGSRFLAAIDVKAPINATIERVELQPFTRPNEPPHTRAVVYVKGGKKGIVLNKTNASILAAAFGKDFKSWVGRRILIRPEPVVFAGKATTGLRLYPAPNGSDRIETGPPPAPATAPQTPPSQNEMADEIPPW
jgi:hypothetical protein